MIAGREAATPTPTTRYELTVSGTIGPVVRSCFPELATDEVASHSLVTGHCAGPDELRALLDLLASKGFPAANVHLIRR